MRFKIMFQALLVRLMSTIHGITAESLKMASNCYKLQDIIKHSPTLQQEITYFAIELRNNVAIISARDLFDINNNTLFKILATTVTYFVVILQLI